MSMTKPIIKYCNMWMCPSDYICARYTENRNPNLEYGDFNPQMDGKCDSFIPVHNCEEVINKKLGVKNENNGK